MRMIKLIILFLFISCNKIINRLIHKNKIGNDFWELIKKDEDEELKKFLKKEENKYINLNELINKDGETALTLAAKYNSLGVVEVLLSKGIDVSEVNEKGQTALIVSILKSEASIERDEIIDKLLEAGVNVNVKYGLLSNNALMLAIAEGDFHTTNKILNKSIDINAQNLDGETALILVVKNKVMEIQTKVELISKFLQFKDIDINIKNSEGNRAITYAINDNNYVIMNTFLTSIYRNIIINEMLDRNMDIDTSYTTNRNNLLMLALEQADIRTIEKIIDKGVDINYQNLLGETALTVAIKNKFMEIGKKEELVKILLDIAGINVNLRDIEGRPALTHAIIDNNPIIVKMLLNSDNIKINVVDKEGKSSLDHIDFNDFKIELLISLIEKDAIVVNTKDFYRRAREDYLEDIVKFLMKNMIEEIENKIKKKELINILRNLLERSKNFTIEKANNVLDIINYFSDKIDIKSVEGYEEIIEAIFKKSVSKRNSNILKNVLKKVNDLESKDKNGRTALTLAAENRYVEILKILIEKGADVNAKNEYGETAMIEAAKNGNLEIVKMLIEKGADINTKDKNEYTALMRASYLGKNTEIVKVLIEAGADVKSVNKDGETALMKAASYWRSEEKVRILIKAGADVKAKDKYGKTALMRASYSGNIEIVKMLIEARADINTRDLLGNTALYYADLNLHEETKKLLLEGEKISFK